MIFTQLTNIIFLRNQRALRRRQHLIIDDATLLKSIEVKEVIHKMRYELLNSEKDQRLAHSKNYLRKNFKKFDNAGDSIDLKYGEYIIFFRQSRPEELIQYIWDLKIHLPHEIVLYCSNNEINTATESANIDPQIQEPSQEANVEGPGTQASVNLIDANAPVDTAAETENIDQQIQETNQEENVEEPGAQASVNLIDANAPVDTAAETENIDQQVLQPSQEFSQEPIQEENMEEPELQELDNLIDTNSLLDIDAENENIDQQVLQPSQESSQASSQEENMEEPELQELDNLIDTNSLLDIDAENENIDQQVLQPSQEFSQEPIQETNVEEPWAQASVNLIDTNSLLDIVTEIENIDQQVLQPSQEFSQEPIQKASQEANAEEPKIHLVAMDSSNDEFWGVMFFKAFNETAANFLNELITFKSQSAQKIIAYISDRATKQHKSAPAILQPFTSYNNPEEEQEVTISDFNSFESETKYPNTIHNQGIMNVTIEKRDPAYTPQKYEVSDFNPWCSQTKHYNTSYSHDINDAEKEEKELENNPENQIIISDFNPQNISYSAYTTPKKKQSTNPKNSPESVTISNILTLQEHLKEISTKLGEHYNKNALLMIQNKLSNQNTCQEITTQIMHSIIKNYIDLYTQKIKDRECEFLKDYEFLRQQQEEGQLSINLSEVASTYLNDQKIDQNILEELNSQLQKDYSFLPENNGVVLQHDTSIYCNQTHINTEYSRYTKLKATYDGIIQLKERFEEKYVNRFNSLKLLLEEANKYNINDEFINALRQEANDYMNNWDSIMHEVLLENNYHLSHFMGSLGDRG